LLFPGSDLLIIVLFLGGFVLGCFFLDLTWWLLYNFVGVRSWLLFPRFDLKHSYHTHLPTFISSVPTLECY
jgi:hypothetical protein